MRQRDVERLDVLAGEHRAHHLDAARDRDRQRRTERGLGAVDADQSRLQVQRVLRGLEQEQVGAALDQPDRLLAIVLGEVVPASRRR